MTRRIALLLATAGVLATATGVAVDRAMAPASHVAAYHEVCVVLAGQPGQPTDDICVTF